MSQFIEVVYFKSSAYTADASKYDSAILNEFGKVDGVVARYKGHDLADANSHVWVIVWASQAQFEKFFKEVGDKIVAPFAGEVEGTPSLNTISGHTGDYTKVLASPVVQFSLLAPKAGVSAADVKPIIQQIVESEDTDKQTLGYLRSPVNEKPDHYLAIVGWNSKEDHDAVAAKHTGLAQLAAKVDADIKLTKLTPYSS